MFSQLDWLYLQKKFTKEIFNFIQSLKRRTDVMICCRIPKFCEKDKIDIRIIDLKRKKIPLRSVKKINFCQYIHKKNQYCVVWKKKRKDSLVNGLGEIEANFKHVKNGIIEENFSQKICYRFPKQETIDQPENVFVFDLEIYNDQRLAEAYATSLYDVNRLRDHLDGDLTPDEFEKGGKVVIDFDGSSGNPNKSLYKYISENYGGDERTYINREGDEIVRSCRIWLLTHNTSVFDSWVLLNSLDKKITDSELIRFGRGLISLPFNCRVEIANSIEVPQSVKVTCTRSHISGSLEKSRKRIRLQAELLKKNQSFRIHWVFL